MQNNQKLYSYTHRYDLKRGDDFPVMENDQYKELHAKGDFNGIVKNSYRLCTKLINRYKIPPTDDLWQDLFQSCVAKLVEITPKWEPAKGKYSTYSYWWIHKAIQEHMKYQGGLSYGNYDDYRRKSRTVVYMSDKISGGTTSSKGSKSFTTIGDTIEDERPNPYQVLENKEHDDIRTSEYYSILLKGMSADEIKGLKILVFKKRYEPFKEGELEFLLETVLPLYKLDNPASRLTPEKIQRTKKFKMQSLSRIKSHLRRKAKKILLKYKEVE